MTADYQPEHAPESVPARQESGGQGRPSDLRCACLSWTWHCDLAARITPEVVHGRCPSKAEGAGKAGCPRHPQSCARTHMTDRRCAGTPGLPCAVVLTAYGALSPETNSSCLRRRRIDDVPIRLDQTHLRRLDTSNGCQDHTVLPSAASLARRPDQAHVLPAEISREGV